MTLLGEHGERAIQNVSPGHDETLGVEPEIADLHVNTAAKEELNSELNKFITRSTPKE